MTIIIKTANNPKYTSQGMIELTITTDTINTPFQFFASENDVEPYGVELYNNAIAGVYGVIAPYDLPVINVDQYLLSMEISINKYMDIFAGTWGYGIPPGSDGSLDKAISYIGDSNVLWNNEAVALKTYRSHVWAWFINKGTSIKDNSIPRPINTEEFIVGMPSYPIRPTS